jgi:hypothetical protein
MPLEENGGKCRSEDGKKSKAGGQHGYASAQWPGPGWELEPPDRGRSCFGCKGVWRCNQLQRFR